MDLYFLYQLKLIPFFKLEPLWGIEPQTSSLPRKCSTTELQRPNPVSMIQPAVDSLTADRQFCNISICSLLQQAAN